MSQSHVVFCGARASDRTDLRRVRLQTCPAVAQEGADRAASQSFRLLSVPMSRVLLPVFPEDFL